VNEPADISVFSSDKRLELIVEVKTKYPSNAEWATKFRRNLLSNGAIPHTPFFMLALPDRLYLWKNGYSSSDERPPDFVIDSSLVVADYSSDSKRTTGATTLRVWSLYLALGSTF
jgi:hypothetical protein